MSIIPFKMKIIPAINAAAETVSGENVRARLKQPA